MSVQPSPYFNDPTLAQAASNLSAFFAPAGAASGSDAAGYATADAKRAEMNRLGQYFQLSQDPNVDLETLSRVGTGLGLMNFTNNKYGVDQGNINNLEQRRLMEQGLMDRQLISPIQVNQDQKVFLPPALSEKIDLPAILEGNRSPLTAEQVKGARIEKLAPELQDAIAFGSTPVKEVVTPEGVRNVTSLKSIGQEPYLNKGPQTVVNMGPNGVDYGDPGKGLAWARDAEGKVLLDERGAPIAIPFQGGEVWQKQKAAEEAAAVKGGQASTKNNIVLQDIDRALGMIKDSPWLTTGVGNQITGAIGGTPAHDVNALLDTVKANVGFDQLQAMRDASPTGGALGSITEFENKLLQSVLGSMETSQGKDQLEFNLKRLYSVVDEIVNRGVTPEKAGQMNFDGDGGGAQVGTGLATGTPDGTIIENDTGDRMIRRGGKWEPYNGR